VPRDIGVVEKGASEAVGFVHGKLRVGEAMSPPLIRAVKSERDADAENAKNAKAVDFLDAPPGTSCPVIVAVSGADFVLLVTEPTPFGLNDLGLALEMVAELRLPHAVVVNRHEEDNEDARTFCRERGVEILAEIPDDRRVAEAYSRGEMAVNAVPGFERMFLSLWDALRRSVEENGQVRK
jgi:MinD superfamily P-loop ATPase